MWARDEDEWIRMGVTEKGAGLSGAPPQAPNRSKGISGPLGAGFQKGVSKIRVYKYTYTHTHTFLQIQITYIKCVQFLMSIISQ